MAIGLTSFSAFKSQPKLNFADNRSRFTSFNTLPTKKSKSPLLLSANINKTNKLQSKKPKNILVLSKKTTVIQPRSVADKNGVVLYQQVERSKSLSIGSELINRFNLRA